MHASPQMLWSVFTYTILAGWSETRSATVRDFWVLQINRMRIICLNQFLSWVRTWKCMGMFTQVWFKNKLQWGFRNNHSDTWKKKESDPRTLTSQMGLRWPDVSVGCSSFCAWLGGKKFFNRNPGRWLDSKTLSRFPGTGEGRRLVSWSEGGIARGNSQGMLD